MAESFEAPVIRPLFPIGNRRSGTSMLTLLLNAHHEIYMGLEHDTIWYINSHKSEFAHPDDDPNSLQGESGESKRPLNPIHDQMIDHGSPRDQFERDLLLFAKEGREGYQDAYPDKKNLKWIGDKKPNTITDPSIRIWFDNYFSDARLIHMVRDPVTCIASMIGLGWDGSPGFLTNYYVRLERQAQEMSEWYPTIFIKFEDMCIDPWGTLGDISEFLDIDPNNHSDALTRGEILPEFVSKVSEFSDPNSVIVTDDVKHLREQYGYQ